MLVKIPTALLSVLVVVLYLLLLIPVIWVSLSLVTYHLLYNVTDIVSKAHMRTGLILRTFMSRDIHLLKRAFLVYVRPIVEHNSVIWSPYSARNIEAVESVQRRFTKRLPTLSNMSYNDRLSCLNISSLELR